jgi:hypothetical protein
MDLLIGFSTILVVIACGTALAHVGVLDARSQRAPSARSRSSSLLRHCFW